MSEPCEHGHDGEACVRCEQERAELIVSGDGSGIDGPLGHPGIAFCHCGSAWFKAVVSFNQQGHVIAYASGGENSVTCLECAEVKPSGFVGDHPWQFDTAPDDAA